MSERDREKGETEMKKRVTITNRNYESFLGFTKREKEREKEIEKRGRQRER